MPYIFDPMHERTTSLSGTLPAGVIHATSAEEIEVARDLFREYQRTIDVDLCFQNFEQELASLPGDYAPPSGRLLLAKLGGDFAGCVALRKLSDSTCEIKRLFVRPSFHHHGIGRKLASAIIEEAWRTGYSAMRLDTLATMREAAKLYVSLGFRPIPAYNFHPLPGTLYFELALREPLAR
jgi:GNAT superfamily N-acetyltransferase